MNCSSRLQGDRYRLFRIHGVEHIVCRVVFVGTVEFFLDRHNGTIADDIFLGIRGRLLEYVITN